MAKFNWDRFYDELDEANPKKFPYWMWATREFTNGLESLFIALLQTIFTLIFMLLFGRWLLSDPDIAPLLKNTAYYIADNIRCGQKQ